MIAKLRSSLVVSALLVCSGRVANSQNVAYVTNQSSNTVSVIDTSSGTVNGTVAVGSTPFGVAITPDANRAYVANFSSSSVSVIDTSSGTVTATVAVGNSPLGVAISPDGTRAYVSNLDSNSVSVIDTSSNIVIATVAVGSKPFGVAISPDGTRAYVTNQVSNSVSMISTANNTVFATVAVGIYPQFLAFTPDGTRVYVTNESSGSVSVINTASNTVTATVAIGNAPYGLAITPDGTRAYVTNQSSDYVSVINTASNTVAATVAVGNTPYGVAISPDGARAYVANRNSSSVSVIDTKNNTVIASIGVGVGPSVVAITPGFASGLALLNGGNTFTGNQQVNGAVNATSFVGNGAGLTGVNASSLGGVASSNYARLDVGNSFNGNQAVNGSVAAASFVGDGSGLTGITVQTANTANFALTAGDSMTLGGNSSSAFAPASGSASYVSKAGDTMTGTLNLPSNGLIAGSNQFILSGGNVGLGTAAPVAPIHVHRGASGPLNSGISNDVNMVGLFENGGGATNLWLNVKPVNAGATDENYYFAVDGAGAGGLRYNVSGGYVALTTDTTPAGVSNEPFVLKARNVGIGTTTPGAMLDVNGTANFSGLVTFASGQTFPGAGNGTITGVAAGTGLSGGGTTGNVMLNNVGVLSVVGGTGISSTGGQNPSLSLNTGFTDARYAQLGANNIFTGTQSMPSLAALSVNSSVGSFIGNASGATLTVQNNGTGPGLVGLGTNSFGVEGVSGGIGIPGVYGSGSNGPGIFGVTQNSASPAALFRNNAPAGGNILILQNSMLANVFSVDAGGNLVSSGPVTIGGGTAIAKHLSNTFSATFAALKPSTCSMLIFTFTGASDGDAIVLGVPNAMMGVSGIPAYTAWVSATNTITIRACNLDPNTPQKTGASGAIRVDVWKHQS